ncbi:MAG: DUF882 domain-containing protein [Pseudomonadota bacterium]
MFVPTSVAQAETRTLKLYFTHTKERATITYKRNGRYLPGGLKKINRFLRDWRRNEPTRMDPKLLDLVWEVYRKSGSRKHIHVISGYRSPKTNTMLRRRGRKVANKSQHMRGRALDFFLPDVSVDKLRALGLKAGVGGVGYYRNSFVHFDTGRVRHWPRMSRRQLARIFPRGRTLHVPSDGKPLKNYQLAKADYRKKQKGGPVLLAKEKKKKSGGLLAGLFRGNSADSPPKSEPRKKQAPKKPTTTRVAKQEPAKKPTKTELPGVNADSEPKVEEPTTVAVVLPRRVAIPTSRPTSSDEQPQQSTVLALVTDTGNETPNKVANPDVRRPPVDVGNRFAGPKPADPSKRVPETTDDYTRTVTAALARWDDDNQPPVAESASNDKLRLALAKQGAVVPKPRPAEFALASADDGKTPASKPDPTIVAARFGEPAKPTTPTVRPQPQNDTLDKDNVAVAALAAAPTPNRGQSAIDIATRIETATNVSASDETKVSIPKIRPQIDPTVQPATPKRRTLETAKNQPALDQTDTFSAATPAMIEVASLARQEPGFAVVKVVQTDHTRKAASLEPAEKWPSTSRFGDKGPSDRDGSLLLGDLDSARINDWAVSRTTRRGAQAKLHAPLFGLDIAKTMPEAVYPTGFENLRRQQFNQFAQELVQQVAFSTHDLKQ